jgi:hypothetical protein
MADTDLLVELVRQNTAAISAAVAVASRAEVMATKLEEKVDVIGADVKSLLDTRAFTRGAIKVASLIAAVVGSIVSGGLLWLTRHN